MYLSFDTHCWTGDDGDCRLCTEIQMYLVKHLETRKSVVCQDKSGMHVVERMYHSW